jgi:hypothetical protein
MRRWCVVLMTGIYCCVDELVCWWLTLCLLMIVLMTLCWCVIGWCVGVLCWWHCVDVLIRWYVDVLMTLCWCVDDCVDDCVGALMCWWHCVDVLVSWRIGVLSDCVHDCVDAFMCWCLEFVTEVKPRNNKTGTTGCSTEKNTCTMKPANSFHLTWNKSGWCVGVLVPLCRCVICVDVSMVFSCFRNRFYFSRGL